MLEPRHADEDDGIVIEFKVRDSENEKTLDDTVKAALQQIMNKKYAAALVERGVPEKKIRIYGFAFEGQKVMIDGGYISNENMGFSHPVDSNVVSS